MKLCAAFGVAIFCACLTSQAADFDGDGVADEFKVTRDGKSAAADAKLRKVNPWYGNGQLKKTPKGVCLVVGLSRNKQSYLLHDPDYLSTPIWTEGKPPVEMITKKDRRYAAWKKKAPDIAGDGIQLGTEAGIDILLYWSGKSWRVFWPDEEP
jgi:hypothetical protein